MGIAHIETMSWCYVAIVLGAATECTSQNTNEALKVAFALLLGSYNHSLINNKINCCQPTHLQDRHWHATCRDLYRDEPQQLGLGRVCLQEEHSCYFF